jgi:hypothetical protein
MRRILVLLSVVALMVVMLAMSVTPAFAAWDAEGGQCRTGDRLLETFGLPSLDKTDKNNDGYYCQHARVKEKGGTTTTYISNYDNRGF